MSGDLKSLEDISHKRWAERLASHLVRMLLKAADLPQRVSGRYLSVKELRHNLPKDVVTSMQVWKRRLTY